MFGSLKQKVISFGVFSEISSGFVLLKFSFNFFGDERTKIFVNFSLKKYPIFDIRCKFLPYTKTEEVVKLPFSNEIHPTCWASKQNSFKTWIISTSWIKNDSKSCKTAISSHKNYVKWQQKIHIRPVAPNFILYFILFDFIIWLDGIHWYFSI